MIEYTRAVYSAISDSGLSDRRYLVPTKILSSTCTRLRIIRLKGLSETFRRSLKKTIHVIYSVLSDLNKNLTLTQTIQFNSIQIYFIRPYQYTYIKIYILILTGKSGTARDAINLAKTTKNVQSPPQNITKK